MATWGRDRELGHLRCSHWRGDVRHVGALRLQYLANPASGPAPVANPNDCLMLGSVSSPCGDHRQQPLHISHSKPHHAATVSAWHNPALADRERTFMANQASCALVVYFKVGKPPGRCDQGEWQLAQVAGADQAGRCHRLSVAPCWRCLPPGEPGPAAEASPARSPDRPAPERAGHPASWPRAPASASRVGAPTGPRRRRRRPTVSRRRAAHERAPAARRALAAARGCGRH